MDKWYREQSSFTQTLLEAALDQLANTRVALTELATLPLQSWSDLDENLLAHYRQELLEANRVLGRLVLRVGPRSALARTYRQAVFQLSVYPGRANGGIDADVWGETRNADFRSALGDAENAILLFQAAAYDAARSGTEHKKA
jgi:hypothetical protein